MFSFFKRSDSVPQATAHRSASPVKNRSAGSRGIDFLNPLPVPEVREGNEDSDWAMWEDSVLEQDSHLPAEFADTQPSVLDEPTASELVSEADPFSKVFKHAP